MLADPNVNSYFKLAKRNFPILFHFHKTDIEKYKKYI